MSLYKKRSLIPEPAAPALKPPAVKPDRAAPTAPRAVAVDAAQAVAQPVANSTPGAPPPAPPELWANGRWAVTEAGLESRTLAGPHRRLIDYVIEAPRLLRLQSGQPGVSSWALQLAAKSWVDDPEALIDALAQALRIHHPDQTAVDLVASAEAARLTWARYHSPKPAPRDWTAEFPPQYREALLRNGMNPDDHPAARAYDQELIRRVEAGLTGRALDDAAGALWDEHFFEREQEEEAPPEELDLLIDAHTHRE